jgi:molybdopterin molybdotransferase
VNDDLDVADAVARVLAECAPLPLEQADPLAARGRVLAADVHARWPLPGADVSTMDGWAVRAADLSPGTPAALLRIAGESAAGHPQAAALAPGEAARISTGAVLPPGADAVIAQEDSERRDTDVHIDLARAGHVRPGLFVRRAGSDVEGGERLLSAGTVLGPGDLALAVAAGHVALPVHRAPWVGILCTGDELVPPGCAPGHGQVVSTNHVLLASQIREAGAIPFDLGLVGDDPDALREALARGLASADVLLTSGGISVGDHDLVFPALRELGLRPAFRRVRLRPGRPLTFGRLGEALVFALPGNPASTFVGFELFVRPALRKLAGHPRPLRPLRRLTLAAPAASAGKRAHYVRARLHDGRAEPLPNQASGALTSLRGCDALLAIPPGPDLPAGAEVDALVLRDPDVP